MNAPLRVDAAPRISKGAARARGTVRDVTDSLAEDRAALKPLPPERTVDLPESRAYRFKARVLGKPMDNADLAHERLGKPTALAVFASDALSSTAYASEEILRTLLVFGGVGGIGVVAYRYLTPITIALVVVMVILIFSYRQTIKAYPSAGGAYIVTKDNLGVIPAQIAGVALLTDYILTVAVSTSAGVAALYSTFHGIYPYRVPVALGFIAIISVMNLRGVKESGKIFAVPTYAFILCVFTMIITGVVRALFGSGLEAVVPEDPAALEATGAVGIFLLLHAFASGGAAMTGIEAISNGVPAFRKVEWKNARETLTIMGVLLATMFLGLSWLASKLEIVPSESKTVISQIAEAVFGDSTIGHIGFVATQAATMLILVLAANTAFADFPRLASFQAEDSFMPRQLTKRGHRLVYSNGIISLAIAAAVPVIILGADVTKLIPLYAVGVFTSFTLSQAGMARKHIVDREQGWRIGLIVNALGAFTTLVVTIVIASFKFMDGAWLIIVLVPVLVVVVVRLNKVYETEQNELAIEARRVTTMRVRRTLSVIVMVGKIDRSTARALQYARTMHPDHLKAVHIATDDVHANELRHEWTELGLAQIPLEIIECTTRRINRSALEMAAQETADPKIELTVLIPRREYRNPFQRLLHDRTGDSLARTLSGIKHVNVTFVPYLFNTSDDEFVDATDALR